MITSSRIHAVVVGVLLVGTLALGQTEQWLNYRNSREASEILGPLSQLALGTVESPGDVGMPEFKTDNPVFARWPTPMVADGYLWVALDRSDPAKPHDLLFIDSDGDGDLSDEQAQQAYRLEPDRAYFGPVKVVFQAEDGPVAYHLNVQYLALLRTLYVSSAGWYEGTVPVGGQEMHVILADQNANGAFDDQAAGSQPGDSVSIAREGQSAFRALGSLCELDGRYYNLKVARDGAFVIITPATNIQLGTVELPETITGLTVIGPQGQFDCVPDDGSVSLPVGAYRIASWTSERKDSQGRQWKVVGSELGGNGVFNVSVAEQVSLDLGEPLISSLTVNEGADGAYAFNLSATGRLGETIELSVGGNQPPPARLLVKDRPGDYDRAFSFAYG